jgi:addiction module HigA family antidote
MKMKPSKRLDPVHSGEILLEDFMRPLGISINQLARDLDVPPNRIGAIVNGARSITVDTALRLGTYFRVSPETWLGLKIDYDLRLIRQRDGDRGP